MRVRPLRKLTVENKWRFLTLMCSILLLFISFPFLSEFRFASLILEIYFTIIVLSGVFALAEHRRLVIAAIVLAVLSLITGWTTNVVQIPFLVLLSGVLYMLFFLTIAVSILIHVLRNEEITAEKIYGAISVYFFIGLIWALFYSMIACILPESFAVSGVVVNAREAIFSKTQGPLPFLYYSLVTLTTLGYGDITPLSAPARIFSALEAMVGQLYLAVLIARLVGLHIAYSNFRKRGERK